MRIAVTAQGRNEDDAVDPRFGRAHVFLLYDTDSDRFEVLGNEDNIGRPQGAGIQAASQVARSGAEVVLTGHCGPKAFETLRAAGIEVVTGAEGTVRQAIDRYRAGELKPVAGPDKNGHW